MSRFTSEIERPRDYDAVPVIPDPAPSPPNPTLPEVRRVDYGTVVMKTARKAQENEDEAGRLHAEAIRMAPLQSIQVAFDQLVTRADEHRRGTPWMYAGSDFRSYTRDVMDHVKRHRDVLRVAASAADAMVEQMTDQLTRLGEAMADQKQPEGPQLTTTGAPHPLQTGGYQANEDEQRAANQSDVAALKAGQATQDQAEALAKADVPVSGDPSNPDMPSSSPSVQNPEDKPKPKKGK